MPQPNVKLTNRNRENGGSWFVEPGSKEECARMAYIRKTLAEYMAEEPSADWHLECCGTVGAWHRWDSL